MKITNRNNYPEAFVLAVTNDNYSRGDSEFSATSLLQPPRITALLKKHDAELEKDVDDMAFILYGHLGHAILERANKSCIVEKRYFGEIDGVKISAQVDSLSLGDDGLLIDWKFTTVYGFKHGSKPKEDWVKQMNIQLELLRQNGLEAKKMQIWGMLRDWRPGESKKEGFKYPSKLGHHDIPIFPRPETRGMIRNMIAAHRHAEHTLPLCSPEDNWGSRRCLDYCEVSKFCSQYQQSKKTGIINKGVSLEI